MSIVQRAVAFRLFLLDNKINDITLNYPFVTSHVGVSTQMYDGQP